MTVSRTRATQYLTFSCKDLNNGSFIAHTNQCVAKKSGFLQLLSMYDFEVYQQSGTSTLKTSSN